MSTEEALQIINAELRKLNKPILPQNYSRDELNKARRDLAQKYHPNAYLDDSTPSEDQMKHFNGVCDILGRKFKPVSAPFFDESETPYNLDEVKKEYIKKIEFYGNVNANEDTMSAHNEIAILISTYTTHINSCNSKEEVINKFEEFKNKKTTIYINLLGDFFDKYLINQEEVTESISFGLNLDAFYNALLVIKKKYSPIAKLEELSDAYKLYAGYNELQELINNIITELIKKLKENKITTEEAYTEATNKIQDLFNRFYTIKNRINELKEDENITLALLNEIEKLEKELEKVRDLSLIERKIKEIEEKNQKRELLKSQMPEINQIYTKVMAKAISCLQPLNPNEDNLIFTYINDCIIRIANIFKLAFNNLIDIEVLKCLEQLTFSELDVDTKILSFIEESFAEKPEINKLFVRRDDNKNIYMLIEVGETYKLAKWRLGSGVVLEEVSKKSLQEDYMPLDDFLNDNHLIWKVGNYTFGRIYFLYSIGVNYNAGFLVLSVDRQDYSFKNISIMSRVSIEYHAKISEISMEKWKDPEYLKQKIIEQIKSALAADYPRERKK